MPVDEIQAPGAKHTRRYTAFISYRHADNTQEGRRWAEWLHRGLERYVVPPDLIGTPNLRGEPIRDSLYPIFRDEDELPANADLATGIRAALEVSDHLIVLCSPRSAVSPWVRKEVREFKELGRSDHILAIIIAGEPNADDPAKAREGILRDEECFCEELRFGAVRDDGTLDWTIRTEPLAADLRPVGTRAEGFVTAEAYREFLTINSSLTPDKIVTRTDAYRQQLERSLLKIIAGLLNVELGKLLDRDAAHRAELAKQELARAEAEAARLRALNERLNLAEAKAREAAADALQAKDQAVAALVESQRQLERSQLEEGRAWLERGRAALNRSDHLRALMLAGRAIGYQGYGHQAEEARPFSDGFLLLLARPMRDPTAEQERAAEAKDVLQFLDSVRPTHLPLWASAMSKKVTCVAFSPDSSRLASGSGIFFKLGDNTIKLWDAASGKELASLQGHRNAVTSVAFSPDGSRLASGSADRTIKLWDTASGKELASLLGHKDQVTSVAFSPDGSRLASGSGDSTIKLWDTASGKELASLQGHTSSVSSIAFSPDGSRLASGSGDSTIKLWDAASGKELASLLGHKDQVTSVAFSPDGSRLASGSGDSTIKLWDTASDKELASLQGHTSSVSSVAFSPDGSRLASGSGDSTIKLWDTASGQELASLQGHTSPVSSVAFSPDGSRLASGSGDIFKLGDNTINNTIKLWDAAPGKELAALLGHTDQVTSVAFSPDGSRLASGSGDGTIKLWDTASGQELASLQGHTSSVSSIAFSPDGSRLASGSGDSTIKLWDTASGKELAALQGHTSPVSSVAFSPDGSRLASGSLDNTIKLWDAASGKELASLQGHRSYVWSVAFSPDGTRLASGSYDNTIKLWDAASGKELAALQGHSSSVSSVAFSPDGSRLASGSLDNTIKLWDAASAKELASIGGAANNNPFRSGITGVAFSPDGSRLASGLWDNTIKLYDAASGKELATASAADLATAKQWLAAAQHRLHPDDQRIAERDGNAVFIVPGNARLDLTAPLRAGLAAFKSHEVFFPDVIKTTPMIHYRQDALAQLAHPKLTPERYAELRMELCTKSSRFRAAIALWQRLLHGEWPGFEGATVPKDQAPATILADSPIRRLYLLALIDATKHPQIHGHPTICKTTAQISPVLTKEMLATPTISLAMMSLMQTLAKDDSPDMSVPLAALMKQLEQVATKEWLAVLRGNADK